jgi:hypothetical protein
MRPQTPPAARALRCAVLLLFGLLAAAPGCARLILPPSPAVVIELESLAAGTEATFAALDADPGPAAAPSRAASYAALEGRARSVAALAEARGGFGPGVEMAETADFMDDYRRNLALLVAHDAARTAEGSPVSAPYAALRAAQMADALNDALVLERSALGATD